MNYSYLQSKVAWDRTEVQSVASYSFDWHLAFPLWFLGQRPSDGSLQAALPARSQLLSFLRMFFTFEQVLGLVWPGFHWRVFKRFPLKFSIRSSCSLHDSHQRSYVELTKILCSLLDHRLMQVRGADQYCLFDALILYYPSSYAHYHELKNETLCFILVRVD